MKKLFLLLAAFGLYGTAMAQQLVHTRLALRPDYLHSFLYGRAWLTLKASRADDSLILDAKGMNIRKVALIKNGQLVKVTSIYDSLKLRIRLDRHYKPAETYTVYIDYTAKPNERRGIKKNEKGLYFINPTGKEKDKPTQIWTEGEPESSSAWFPTVDRPDQKTTSEISLRVPPQYTTLSNGYLASQVKHKDGTRTDTWKMSKPHSPYLFMLAVGDFKIYHDHWRNRPVDYYLEPKYAPYVKDIFGQTPLAMDFFSKTLNVPYPWNKYAQIVVRDYVSGAMENTTASVFGEPSQGTTRDLADRYYDTGFAHELFHQWFGDYVTPKDWAQLTLSESFADFGELIWLEHRYGRDAAGEHWHNGLQTYLANNANWTIPLTPASPVSPADVFNNVTYQKGGRILYLLRNWLGHTAFYKGLEIYLKTHALKNATVSDLQQAMEKASGQQLQWFFDQWYRDAGHPVLDISYSWNEDAKTEQVIIRQTQPGRVFRLPLAVDIYAGGTVKRSQVVLNKAVDTLIFKSSKRPDLVNVDADKVLIAQKTDRKDLAAYVFQYAHAPLYMDRYEALDFMIAHQAEPTGRQGLLAALNDRFDGLRAKAIRALNLSDAVLKEAARPYLLALVQREPNHLTLAATLNVLAEYQNSADTLLFIKGLKSVSYTVQAAGLKGLARLNAPRAMELARPLETDHKGALTDALFELYINYGGQAQWPFIYQTYNSAPVPVKIRLLPKFTQMICLLEDSRVALQGIVVLQVMARQYKAQGAAPYILRCFEQIKTAKEKQQDRLAVNAVSAAVNEISDGK